MSVRNLKQKKIEFRAKHKKIRSNFPPEKKALMDKAIAENFISTDAYQEADVIFVFISKDIEVDTKDIVTKAFADGKKVAAPRCNTEDKLMDYYYISSYDDLVKGSYDLMEPDVNKCEKVTDFDLGVCMVPGLVYDREGYRLGFGKGYYDRFLINFTGVTIGVCYSRCVEQELPRGFYDKPIDLVVTEKYTIDTRNMQFS